MEDKKEYAFNFCLLFLKPIVPGDNTTRNIPFQFLSIVSTLTGATSILP